MRKLLLLPFLIVSVACGDYTPVEPENEVSADLVVATAQGGDRHVVKMVPLKWKGTWWYAETGDPAPCERFSGAVPAFLEFDGTGTHTGRVTGGGTNCLDVSGYPAIAVFSQTLLAIAANGDELYGDGTINDSPPMEVTIDPGVSFQVGPVLFTGGTGRFENASGWYMLSGDYSLFEGNGGQFTVKGMVSTVGSSK